MPQQDCLLRLRGYLILDFRQILTWCYLIWHTAIQVIYFKHHFNCSLDQIIYVIKALKYLECGKTRHLMFDDSIVWLELVQAGAVQLTVFMMAPHRPQRDFRLIRKNRQIWHWAMKIVWDFWSSQSDTSNWNCASFQLTGSLLASLFGLVTIRTF